MPGKTVTYGGGCGNEISAIGPVKKIKTKEQEVEDSKLLTNWPEIKTISED